VQLAPGTLEYPRLYNPFVHYVGDCIVQQYSSTMTPHCGNPAVGDFQGALNPFRTEGFPRQAGQEVLLLLLQEHDVLPTLRADSAFLDILIYPSTHARSSARSSTLDSPFSQLDSIMRKRDSWFAPLPLADIEHEKTPYPTHIVWSSLQQ
jgi:hypothetical protein